MSDEETLLLNLFDTYWFGHGMLAPSKPHLPEKPTLMKKSHSDQFLTSKDFSPEPNSPSPKSVLQTILSGKQVHTFDDLSAKDTKGTEVRIRRKSLSELEFEELKGFMDLGFVFSDQDKDSRLVSIIPGLQRLGKKEVQHSVSRPYLSEAWDCLEQKKREKLDLLVDWRIPVFGNEMELKDHIRFWAHSVASTVIIR